MSLDWNKLKPNFDTRSSFEELCCQLARYENLPENSIFVRKGTPDAGVECFWKLPDNNEWGWQAKWFPTSPSSSQWTQIDNSVKKALEKHPDLTKYFICLPLNRSDERREGQQSFLDKWNEHVEKWKQIKNIDFEYWGSSEIEDRLSRTEHSGRCKYFFDKNFLSDTWFTNKLDEAIVSAGSRYTPELNVKLPIAKIFETLGRTPQFFNRLKKVSKNIKKEYHYAITKKLVENIDSDFVTFDNKMNFIFQTLVNADKIEQKKIDFHNIHEESKNILIIITDIISKLEQKIREIKESEGDSIQHSKDPYSDTFHHFLKLQEKISELEFWSQSDSMLVANTGALLLRGDAGNGKTHLFCDIAKERIANNRPTVLIHGGHLNVGNPKKQILQELDLDGTFDEFLYGLESVAQAHNSRALIMIDALNEGEGQRIWPKYLAELLEIISRYSWIGIAISVRTSYEETIIPEPISSDKLSSFTHDGFKNISDEAIKIFFDNNGIERPSIPLLVPEFTNPLFLKILCKGLKDKGLHKIPKGLKGVTSVYDFFIDTINDKLHKIDFLDYPKHQKKVHKAVDIITELFVTNNTHFLNYDDVDTALQSIHHSDTLSKSLLHHLVSEGILNEDLFFNEKKEKVPVIRFAYERFGDNLIIKNILKDIKTKTNLLKLFNKKGIFGKYFETDFSLMEYRGIIESIYIQIPEQFSKELIELKPKFSNHPVLIESFIDSFMWRHPSSIKKSTLLIIEKYVTKRRQFLDRFFRVLLTITSDPENKLNAIYLNNYLKKMDMPTRDSLWSIFLHDEFYEENNIVKRYIDWAWNGNKSNIAPSSLYLTGLTLTWFLTSSNRHIRDTATKALVGLLFNQLETLRQILKEFSKCNDPYVSERLFAVAYGCVMKSDNKKQIKLLASETYSFIFKNGKPSLNIVLRDYAKGIIDYAIFKKIKLDIDYNKVLPPYKSDLIKKFPTKKQIKLLKQKIGEPSEYTNGGYSIFQSLGSMGDFYRYTIGANSDSFEWSNVPLLQNNRSREKIFQEFAGDINKKQKTAWKNYYAITHEPDKFRGIPKESRKKVFGFSFEDNKFDKVVTDTQNYLYKQLNPKQKRIFSKYIEPYLKHSFNRTPREDLFNLHPFANWIIKRVFELGWTKEKFGSFDRNVQRQWGFRSTDKPERIGKKYQWIAFAELQASISDNFEFNRDFGERSFQQYKGPWQMYDRDIDPSLIMSKTNRIRHIEPESSCWWFPFPYDAWETHSDLDWLKKTTDLPNFESIIEVVNPKDNVKWLVLQSRYNLQQPISAEKEPYDTPRRDIFFHVDSCIIEKSNTKKWYDWGVKQTYSDSRFPDHDYGTNTFLGEFYWAPSVQSIISYGDPFWTKQDNSLGKLPSKAYVPSYRYAQDSEYDCSMTEGIQILLPNKLLVDKMNLKNNLDGTFIDVNNNVVAFDPSVFEEGPSVLLIKKDEFINFLEQNDYNIVWQVIGQKIILGGWAGDTKWKGDLNIHGIYRLDNNEIKGKFDSEYINEEIMKERRNIEKQNN